MASQNVRSFHAYGLASRTSQHTGKANNAIHLTTNHDITLFQETNFLDREDNRLEKILPPGFKVYYSCLNANAAGVATVVSPSLASTHTITKTPLPLPLQGYALCLRFTASDGSSFSVLNVYLSSASPAARTKQISLLSTTPSPTPLSSSLVATSTSWKTSFATLPRSQVTTILPKLLARPGASSRTSLISKRWSKVAHLFLWAVCGHSGLVPARSVLPFLLRD